jgi:hypothetical protein
MQTKLNDNVKHYRPLRPGPESILEAAVARAIEQVVSPTCLPKWFAASLPVGAGMPDLLAISWHPRVVAIADPEVADASILAYLRAVGCARFDTIVNRLGRTAISVSDSLNALIEASVIVRDSGRFSLDPVWRTILPEVVAIEAKVSDWRRAVRQAARNQLFSHRSFVALPCSVASKAVKAGNLGRVGIGVLAVGPDGAVSVIRDAAVQQPKLWAYYYQLAHHVAQDAQYLTTCHSSFRSIKRAGNIQSINS